jgi:type I restriction enzyme S subunit
MSEWQVALAPRDEQDRIVAEIEKQLTRLESAHADLHRALDRLGRSHIALFGAAATGRVGLNADDPQYEQWATTTLGSVATAVEYGTSAKASESGDVPVLRMGNIVPGELQTAHLKYLPSAHEEFPARLLNDGDLLFNRTNSAELVGKSAVYHGVPASCSFASYLIRVRFSAAANADFVAYCINSSLGRAWVASVVTQQVGQANVNGTKLKAFSFRLPTRAVQDRIVDEVERRRNGVVRAERDVLSVVSGAERLRRSILQQAFEGRLVGSSNATTPAAPTQVAVS